LHAPAQSGSDRILKLMNRGYTRGEYVDFVQRALSVVPDLCLAGDFIVGFPTETDEDFEQTCSLVRELPFKNNFIFKYSPRPGTVAIDRFSDDVPDAVKRMRNNRLLAIQSETSRRVHAAWVGRTVDVFFSETRAPRASLSSGQGSAIALPQLATIGRQSTDSWQAIGRTSGDLICILRMDSEESASSLVGTIRKASILASETLFLHLNDLATHF
jgi:tRNA-2-methylthio-N6-dimethylallyladenosine synthase